MSKQVYISADYATDAKHHASWSSYNKDKLENSSKYTMSLT